MRRQPVYFLVDTSESMSGQSIEEAKDCLNNFLSVLKQDPYAAESVYMSVLIFNDDAKQIVPLTQVCDITIPSLQAVGNSVLSKALDLLLSEIDREKIITTAETAGDWKPRVFIITHGRSSDCEESLSKSVDQFRIKSQDLSVITISIGNFTNDKLLTAISSRMCNIQDINTDTVKRFFVWLTGGEPFAYDNYDILPSMSDDIWI